MQVGRLAKSEPGRKGRHNFPYANEKAPPAEANGAKKQPISDLTA
jgi:hypothetical protein